MTSPERSLGSNQVVLGGMMLPLSAMSVSCFIETGNMAKATAISPESTRRCSSANPRMPPTKSIRVERRRSSMPRMLLSTLSERIVTSRMPMGVLL